LLQEFVAFKTEIAKKDSKDNDKEKIVFDEEEDSLSQRKVH